jgi:hypothetical protein
VKVYELLATPDKWCQWHFAVNASGMSVSSLSHDACRWCTSGGINFCYSDSNDRTKMYQKVVDVLQKRGFMAVADFNDNPNTKHKDILNLLKKLDV